MIFAVPPPPPAPHQHQHLHNNRTIQYDCEQNEYDNIPFHVQHPSSHTSPSTPPLIAPPRPQRSSSRHHTTQYHTERDSPPESDRYSAYVLCGLTQSHSDMNGSFGDRVSPSTMPTSMAEAQYKDGLRRGFIDLRNSYREKKSRATPYSRVHTEGDRQMASYNNGSYAHNVDDPLPYIIGSYESPSSISRADRRPLFRSNSSLDVDHVDEDRAPLRRDYGSANSLDVVNGETDSFFDMLQDYKTNDRDQRAIAPPHIREVLRGKQEISAMNKQSNNTVVKQPSSSHDNTDEPPLASPETEEALASPRMKLKTNKSKKDKSKRSSTVDSSSGGILRRIRGKTESSEISTSDSQDGCISAEEKLRRKAIVHYDCQSIGAMLNKNKFEDVTQNRNISTGASAASVKRRTTSGSTGTALHEEDVVGEATDRGDGKSNNLLLNCPYFRNELGGEEERIICLNRANGRKGYHQLFQPLSTKNLIDTPLCNSIAILDNAVGCNGVVVETGPVRRNGYVIEHVNHGAFYYRNFFYNTDHQNYFGNDETLGPIGISLRREKVHRREDGETSSTYQHRFIVRTSELQTMRGSIMEDAIPCSSRLSSARGPHAKDILEYLLPDLPLTSLHHAIATPEMSQLIMKLDEQKITNTYKFGIMYCKAGQTTEEEMYNNETSSPAFDEFLQCIGHKVQLRDFDRYRGGLDIKDNSSGSHSVYTEFEDYKVMFHVSTMLPFTANNSQQLMRKRHIGNDIVTIVFQEPGSVAFTPEAITSQFQHVFIIVKAHNPNTEKVAYSLAVSRSKDVPYFGPTFNEGTLFKKSHEFAEFLIVKAINAENAAHKAPKFVTMATRTRQGYLKDIATKSATGPLLDSTSKLSKFSLGSGRKKEKKGPRMIPDLLNSAGLVWAVQVEDFGQSTVVNGLLIISKESLVIMEEDTHHVIFTQPCQAVIGWTSTNHLNDTGVRIYYNNGEYVLVKLNYTESEDVKEIVQRLAHVSVGCETKEISFKRSLSEPLGLHVLFDGVVADVDRSGCAHRAGIQKGCRLVEVCSEATITLTHDEIIEKLRCATDVRVSVIEPALDGEPRRGITASHSPASTCQSIASSVEHLDDLSHSSKSNVRPTISLPARYDTHSQHSMSDLSLASDLRGPRITSSRSMDVARNLDHYYDSNQSGHKTQSSQDSSGSKSSEHASDNERPWRVYRAYTNSNQDFADRQQHSLDISSRQHSRSKTTPVALSPRAANSTGPLRHHDNASSNTASAYAQRLRQQAQQGTHNNNNMKYDLHQKQHNTISYTASGPVLQPPSSDTPSPVPPVPPPRHHGSVIYPPRSHTGFGNSQSNLSTTSDPSTLAPGTLPNSLSTSAVSISGMDNVHHESKLYNSHPNFPTETSCLTVRLEYSPPQSSESSHHTTDSQSCHQKHRSEDARNRRATIPSKHGSAALHQHGSTSAGHHTMGSSNASDKKSTRFQQELKRLIDPDVSLTELKEELDVNSQTSRLLSHAGSGNLHRTLSDDSICESRNLDSRYERHVRPRKYMLRDLAMYPGGYKTSTSDHQINNRSDVHAAIPVSAIPSTVAPVQVYEAHSTPVIHHNTSGDIVPQLNNSDPCNTSNNWNSIVQTATKVLDNVDISQEVSAATISDIQECPPVINHPGDSTQLGRPAVPERTVWKNSASNQRLQELETQVTELQQELQEERNQKEQLQCEVNQLREDNLRLQDESTKAAKQLRHFTE